MSQKLTAQRAALYYGCDVTTKYDEGKSYKMVGLSTDMGNLQVLTGGGDTDWWNIDICQLLLTPLEKITDEHAVMVAKAVIPSLQDLSELRNWGRCFVYNIIGNYVVSKFETGWGLCQLDIRNIVDLLRSLGYDVDNAIQDGWAVDKTKMI